MRNGTLGVADKPLPSVLHCLSYFLTAGTLEAADVTLSFKLQHSAKTSTNTRQAM